MEKREIKDFLEFVKKSPTSFHAVANARAELEAAGFLFLDEKEAWKVKAGGAYFTTRGDSSLIAFRIPKKSPASFRMAAAHSDSPGFKLKPKAETEAAGAYTVLNVEPYGGAIWHTWMDRPLSVAGRVVVRTGKGPESRLVNIDRDLLVIPSLAIHMNREVNKKLELNAQKDLLPVCGDAAAKGKLRAEIAKAAGCREVDILDEDLFLYSRVAPTVIGVKGDLLCGPRLDDLECAFGLLRGFLDAAASAKKTEAASPQKSRGKDEPSLPVYILSDNEEVGSQTRQGAASTFLADVLERICLAMGWEREKYHRMIAGGFLVSADNAHAVHPNAPEKADPVNRPVMNGGLVLKRNANQTYTTDAVSAASFRELCRANRIPVQEYTNRSDERGGSTLGNISNTQVSVSAVDIGLGQLAMHSVCETAGAKDLAYLIAFAKAYYL